MHSCNEYSPSSALKQDGCASNKQDKATSESHMSEPQALRSRQQQILSPQAAVGTTDPMADADEPVTDDPTAEVAWAEFGQVSVVAGN